MTDDIAALKAEIERLRELLCDNGIDPEPYVAPPPTFGPPTLLEHITRETVARFAALWVPDGTGWPGKLKMGSTLRVRLPKDFVITRNHI